MLLFTLKQSPIFSQLRLLELVLQCRNGIRRMSKEGMCAGMCGDAGMCGEELCLKILGLHGSMAKHRRAGISFQSRRKPMFAIRCSAMLPCKSRILRYNLLAMLRLPAECTLHCSVQESRHGLAHMQKLQHVSNAGQKKA